MEFGVYFYPWYNRKRWGEAPRRHTPLIGEYDSRDINVIEWQTELIQLSGFDYIIFEMVPFMDWCFHSMTQAVTGALSRLRAREINWSFLIDTTTLPERDGEYYQMEALVDFFEVQGWTSGLQRSPRGKKLLFAYAPLPANAERLRKRYPQYDFRFPIWLPHWEDPDGAFEMPVHRPYAKEAVKEGVTVYDSLVPSGYISFWENSDGRRVYDGFSPVMPGYDDALLKRSPQLAPGVPSGEGRTLVRQMESAVAKRPDHVLVYSWNEYFETTNIEPTKEYGTLYVDLIRQAIRDAKQLG